MAKLKFQTVEFSEAFIAAINTVSQVVGFLPSSPDHLGSELGESNDQSS